MSKIITCPICNGNYYSLEFCGEVCELHNNWIVTFCRVCDRPCFSDCRGYCVSCNKGNCNDAHTVGFGHNKDHRAALRSYGLE